MKKKTYIKNCLTCGIIVQFDNSSGKRCKPCAIAHANKQRGEYKRKKVKSLYIKKGNKPNKKGILNRFANDPNYEGKMI